MSKTWTMPEQQIAISAEVEVLVVGGGPSGIAAAIAAARNGASTLIIEQRGFLGGMATVSLVPAFSPFTDKEKPVVRGLGLELLERMKANCSEEYQIRTANLLDWVPIDAEVLKRVYDDAVEESAVQVLFHTFVIGVVKSEDNAVVEGVIIANKSGCSVVKCRYVIDGTGDGDIAAKAGVAFQKGGDKGQLQPGTMCYLLARADKARFQQYLDDSGDNGQIGLAVSLAQKNGDLPEGRKEVSGLAWVADDLVGVNFGHIFGVDGTRAEDLTRGAIQGRRLAAVQVNFLRRYVPGFENVHIVATGEQIGIRETRRIEGEYILQTEDFMEMRSFDDDIARNSYFIDVHMATSKDKILIHRLPPGKSHGVPYRCMLPKNVDNLWVPGRASSTDRAVQGSLRVMSNCFAMGQAAGTAAALAMQAGGLTARQVDVPLLQRTLIQQGAWLGEELVR